VSQSFVWGLEVAEVCIARSWGAFRWGRG